MRGELDWIVMKALEKDRDRRYETANGFAGDMQRYLDDEPVEACPPSAWYRLRKFARRNRGGAGDGGAGRRRPDRGHGREHLAGRPRRPAPNAGPATAFAGHGTPWTGCPRGSPWTWPMSPAWNGSGGPCSRMRWGSTRGSSRHTATIPA